MAQSRRWAFISTPRNAWCIYHARHWLRGRLRVDIRGRPDLEPKFFFEIASSAISLIYKKGAIRALNRTERHTVRALPAKTVKNLLAKNLYYY